MTQKYEFESPEEMRDYFDGEEVKIISQRPTSNGILVEVEVDSIPMQNSYIVDEKKWYLVCYPNGNIYNPMYWGKKGPTYTQTERCLFTEKQASDKLKYMNSHYNWEKKLA